VLAHGPLPLHVAAGWLVGVLCALSTAHGRGIVHRDVKPANVLIRGDGRALLADFGIMRTPDGDLPVGAGALGTPSYMPPEQRLCADDVGPESDVYAAGATLFALLTARKPFGLADALRGDERWELLPAELRPVVFRATRRLDADRYASARTMALALSPFVRPAQWAAEPHLAAWLG